MNGSECKFVKYMEGSDKRFVIPVYQRNYDWKTENCKQLYDDLVKIIKGNRKSHFFGSLVSVYNPDGHNEEFLIIDGQQRLTTVSLLFLAMCLHTCTTDIPARSIPKMAWHTSPVSHLQKSNIKSEAVTPANSWFLFSLIFIVLYRLIYYVYNCYFAIDSRY